MKAFLKIKNSLVLIVFFISISTASLPLFADWPFETGGESGGYIHNDSPVIADINHDNMLEVLTVNRFRRLFCFSPAGDLLWSQNLYDETDAVDESVMVTQPVTAPTLADLDSDPSTLEIVVGSNSGNVLNPWSRIYVFSSEGLELARLDLPHETQDSQIDTNFTVVDTDQNGQPEIYFGFGSKVLALNVTRESDDRVTLSEKWQFQMESTRKATDVIAANFINDSKLELVVGTTFGRKVYCLNSDGELVWLSTNGADHASNSVLVNYGSGDFCIIQRGWYGEITCLSAKDGALRWRYSDFLDSTMAHNHPPFNPSVADINRDGVPEIIYGVNRWHSDTRWYVVHPRCLDRNGHVCADWNPDTINGTITSSSPAVFRIGGSSDLQIVFGGFEGIHAINQLGRHLWTAGIARVRDSSVALADLDGNGDIEICYQTEQGIVDCLNHDGSEFQYDPSRSGTAANLRPWLKIHHDERNTGMYREFPDRYLLTVNIIGAGRVSQDPNKPAYLLGQTVWLYAQPDPGWQFQQWSGQLSGAMSNPVDITIMRDTIVSAQFVEIGARKGGKLRRVAGKLRGL